MDSDNDTDGAFGYDIPDDTGLSYCLSAMKNDDDGKFADSDDDDDDEELNDGFSYGAYG
jgi:hypothetical protein